METQLDRQTFTYAALIHASKYVREAIVCMTLPQVRDALLTGDESLAPELESLIHIDHMLSSRAHTTANAPRLDRAPTE